MVKKKSDEPEFVQINFDRMKRALAVLKGEAGAPPKPKYPCRTDLRSKRRRRVLQYCALLTACVYRRRWRSMRALLPAYIDAKKMEGFHRKLILRYAVMYMLNDPVALREGAFEQLVRAEFPKCTPEHMELILRRLMTFPTTEKVKSEST